MTAIVTIGIDLAKNVFAVHGVDATGKPDLAPQRARGEAVSCSDVRTSAFGHEQSQVKGESSRSTLAMISTRRLLRSSLVTLGVCVDQRVKKHSNSRRLEHLMRGFPTVRPPTLKPRATPN
jgi:hypothetical protein